MLKNKNMLPFKNRLVKRKEHERVQKLGRFISSKNIAAKVLENDLNETRIGIVVGIKYSKKAIERNQTKKVLREALRPEIKNLKKGLDIIIMAKKREEEKLKSINFKKNIAEILVKGDMLKKAPKDNSQLK